MTQQTILGRHWGGRVTRSVVWLGLAAVWLAACDNDSSSGDTAPAVQADSNADTVPPTSEDTPPPTSEDTPPPTSEDAPPPLAATAISLDDGKTLGSPHWPDSDTSSGGLGQTVDGLECVAQLPTGYHAHSHLSIFLNGESLTVPQHIGIVEPTPDTECHYPLHTHDESGLLHLHAEALTTFTLGQLFDIWGHPLERDNVAGLMGLPVEVYITDDDTVAVYDGELRDIELLSHREITFQIGTPIEEVPRYAWSGM